MRRADLVEEPSMRANRSRPDVVLVIAGDAKAPIIARMAEHAGRSILVEPTSRAIARGVAEARSGKPPAKEHHAVAAILPSAHPELVAAAAIRRVDRIAVAHAQGPSTPLAAKALRAAFAIVDLTIAPDAESERSAIRAGADPNRLAHDNEPILDRLLDEPPRRARLRALLEIGASLALDAAEASGLLRLAELASPDRGVNVVTYHRILPVPEIRSYCRPQMALAAPLFEAQLDEMKKHRGFAPIESVREADADGKVSITFDDGYEDNFRVALPILQRFSTPACIFVVTRLIGRPDALWWDRLGFALLAYWRLGAPRELPEALPPGARALRTATSIDEVRTIVSDLITELNQASTSTRAAAVAAAESLVPANSAGRTMLSWEEVEAMARLGVRFGAHTKNHVPLSELTHDQAAEEILGSLIDLDQHLDRSQPKVVALPRGHLGSLTEDELRLAGFRAVMTSEPGINRAGERSLFVRRRDGRMLTLNGRHHPAKLRLELTGIVDRLREAFGRDIGESAGEHDDHAGPS
jgi:peptidoglycan/xylan/chitin deacetylase (PgdA/CDA1 family)